MARLMHDYPSRSPGSAPDDGLATAVGGALRSYGFSTTRPTFSAHTTTGTRTLENVIATRPGTDSGSIVIVAHRDAHASPALADLSGTATLLELARVLQGETLNRTVVLASTSGAEGAAGAAQLAHEIPGPIDAVIVLGDLASAHARQPIIVPWSMSDTVAPPVLRNTLAAAIADQSTVSNGFTGIGGQLARLAFPFTLSEQAPFAARGIPAVELSMSGEAGAGRQPAGAPIGGTPQLAGLGRAVLATISALDGGAPVPAPSSYVLLAGKVVPGWAMSLFVLTLLVPIALTAIDGLARARRRGHHLGRSLALVLMAAVPFALGLAVVVLAGTAGILPVTPAGPVASGAVPIGGSGIAVMVAAAVVAVVAAVAMRAIARAWIVPAPARASTSRADSRTRGLERPGDGVAVALLIVLCLVTAVIWVHNPYAAALLVPALHLWVWAVDPDRSLALAARIGLIAAGAIPAALVVAYYADVLHFGAAALPWSATLLVAGHSIGVLALLEWSLVLGCLVSAAVFVIAMARRPSLAPAPVTVRGPITYAGPGSLGGTESAMRR
jgi:hypothetical protein